MDINITLLGRDFTVTCADGQEQSLRMAEKILASEAEKLAERVGNVPLNQLLVILGLVLSDEKITKATKISKLQEEITKISKLQEEIMLLRQRLARAEQAASAPPVSSDTRQAEHADIAALLTDVGDISEQVEALTAQAERDFHPQVAEQ